MSPIDTRLVNDVYHPKVSPLMQPIVQPLTQSLDNGLSYNDDSSLIMNDVSADIEHLESVIRDALDYIRECYLAEVNLVRQLDLVVQEAQYVKMRTETEAKEFVDHLQKFSDFVRQIEKRDK